MKKRTLSLVFALCLMLCACSAQQVDAPELKDAVRVQEDSAEVLRGDVNVFEVYDAYVAYENEPAAFTASGTVESLMVKDGETVTAGQVIGSLSAQSLQDQYDGVKESISGLKKERDYQIAQAQADIKLAKLEKDAIAPEDTQAIELKELEIRNLEEQLGYLKEEYALRLEKLEKQLVDAEENLEETQLLAPCDGQVARILKGEGDYVTSAEAVLYVAKTGSEHIRYYGQKNLAKVTSPCAILAGGVMYDVAPMPYPSEQYNALLLDIGTPPGRFSFDKEATGLQVGECVQLYIYSRQAEDVLYIPVNALYRQTGSIGKGYVYKIQDGEKVYADVQFQFVTDSYAVITEGLEEGEVVYVRQ